MRNAWLQRREFQVTDGDVEDPSLELEEGMEEEPAPDDRRPRGRATGCGNRLPKARQPRRPRPAPAAVARIRRKGAQGDSKRIRARQAAAAVAAASGRQHPGGAPRHRGRRARRARRREFRDSGRRGARATSWRGAHLRRTPASSNMGHRSAP